MSIRFFKLITMTSTSLKNAVSTKIKNHEGELEGKKWDFKVKVRRISRISRFKGFQIRS